MAGDNIRQIVVEFLIRDRASAQIRSLNTAADDLGRVATDTGRTMDDMGAAASGAGDEVEQTGETAETTAKKTETLRNSMLALGTAFTAAGAAGYLYFSTMSKGYAKYTGTMTAFNLMAGDASATILAQLRDVTRGTISNADLITAANKAMVMGIEQDTLPRLAEIATAAARVMGIDTSYALDSIVTGIVRNSPRWLDNLGIIVDTTEANEAYAASIGKSAAALTSEEQQMALTIAVMDKGQVIIDKAGTGTDSVATAAARASASIEKMNLAMGAAASGPMMAWYNMVDRVASLVANLPAPLQTVIASIGLAGTTIAGITGPLMLQAAALMFLKNQWAYFKMSLIATPVVSAIATGGISGLTASMYGLAAATWAALTPLLPFVALALGIGGLAALADISANGWDNSFVGQMFGAANPNAAIPMNGTQTINITSTPTQNVEITGSTMSREEIEALIDTNREKLRRDSENDLKRGLAAYQ